MSKRIQRAARIKELNREIIKLEASRDVLSVKLTHQKIFGEAWNRIYREYNLASANIHTALSKIKFLSDGKSENGDGKLGMYVPSPS